MNNAREQRMVPAAAAATAAVTLCLHPLVQGWAWYVGAVVVVAVVAGSGAATRRLTKQPVVVLLTQLLALVVTLTVLFVREQAVFGLLPGRTAISAVAELVLQGQQVAQQQAAPVQAAPGVLLMVAAGIGLVALVVDALAVTWRRPAVAGLALLAVYCVPSAIIVSGTSWVWFAVAAAAYLGLLAAEGGERVRAWGRVLTGERGGAARVNLGSATGARQVAVAAIVLAVVVPAALPSFPRGLSGIGSWGNGPGRDGTQVSVLNPILDLRRNLSERSDQVVLTYRTTVASPGPLRVVVDEEFDGTTWSPSDEGIPRENRVQDGLASPPGLDPGIAVSEQQTSIEIGPRLNQTYLPLPYPATVIDIDGEWIYNSRTLDVLGPDERTAGVDYEVRHLQVQPTPEQLAAAGPAAPDLAGPATRLPDIPQIVRTEARRVAGTGSAYQQAVRLQQWFRSAGGFAYSVDAPGRGPDDGSLSVMEAFLADKRGYCVHFASTMAVMARSLAIPARVAVGFLPGRSTGNGEFEVTFQEAHAWPELYFEGVGWVRFEPTPGVQSGAAPSWTVPRTAATPTATPTPSASVAPSVAPSARPRDETSTTTVEQSTLDRVLAAIPWRVVVGLVLLVGLALVPRVLGASRRSWRWRSVRTRSDRAEAAWDELRALCADLGVGWPRSATPRAVRDELVAAHELDGTSRQALTRLLTDLETARYAPAGTDRSRGRDVATLRRDVRTVVSGIAVVAPARTRRRATWLPATAWQGVETLDRVEDVRERIR